MVGTSDDYLLWLLAGIVVGALLTVAAPWAWRAVQRARGVEPDRSRDDEPSADQAAGDPDDRATRGREDRVARGRDRAARKLDDGAARDRDDGAARDRDTLVGDCVALSDRLRDTCPADWSRLLRDLARIGVEAQIPDGTPFDAAAHDAVGTEPTPPGAHDQTVAETIFPGFIDRGRVLRRPQVVIYEAPDG